VSQRIQVVLIDDHTLFRKGLSELLELMGNITVSACTGNPEQALELIRSKKPQIVMADLNMPDMDGITFLNRMKEIGLDVPTLILTVSDAEEDLAAALRAGARGYLLKDMEPIDVAHAVERVARGETVVAPSMTAKLVNLLERKGKIPEPTLSALTQREHEILEHLARGESNKAIAKALDISADTVKLHVRHILSKLHLTSRVEAAVFAVEHGVSGRRAEASQLLAGSNSASRFRSSQ
jgi:two-component system, NarL family, nitrate/nitrite response regulator NarL